MSQNFNLVPLVRITRLTCQASLHLLTLVVLQYNTHIHWSEEKCSSRGGLTRAGTSVIIKGFGVSRVERPLIDIFWNKDQPHLLCHSLRWRGKRPFRALGSIFPLCLLLSQNSSFFSTIGALYFSPIFPLWISKWHLCEIMLSVRVNWQRSYFFFFLQSKIPFTMIGPF